MEYRSLIRTSGIELTTGNVTPITKDSIVTLIHENEKNVVVKQKWLEIELPIQRFREEFVKENNHESNNNTQYTVYI